LSTFGATRKASDGVSHGCKFRKAYLPAYLDWGFLRHMVSLDLYAVAPVNPGCHCAWYLGFSNRRFGLAPVKTRLSFR